MKYIPVIVTLLVLYCSCGTEQQVQSTPGDSSATQSENTESMPVNGDYIYEITDLKSGETRTLNQQEYLKSEYIDNPAYRVEEKFKVK